MSRRPRLRRALKIASLGSAGVLALCCVFLFVTTESFVAFGGAPSEGTRARMMSSAHFAGGAFVNLEPTEVVVPGARWEMLAAYFGDEMRVPPCPLPMAKDTAARLAESPRSGLRITWLGHSTTLIEIDGAKILTDPMWSARASPSQALGPERFHPPPLALDDLPPLDAVVISHEHFDHLDTMPISLGSSP